MTDSARAAPAERPALSDPDERVRVLLNARPRGRFDHDKIRAGIRLLYEGLGEDPDREGIRDTPERFARMCDEVFGGMLVDARDVLDVVFEEGHNEMVVERDIPVASMCEHHLLPFVGRAHVAYIPNVAGQITGISKLARLVDVVSKRPNLQERMTTAIAELLVDALQPRGVMVVIEAEHLCMTMRGVRKPGAMTVTSAVRGLMLDDASTRAEAMGHIQSGWARSR